MMSANGKLKDGELTNIAGGGRLRHDAADAWNAFARYCKEVHNQTVEVNDSYRPLGKPGDWVYMYWPPSGKGHVGIARDTYKNGLIYTIEGNTHRQGGGGKEGVWRKQHAPSDLHGYLRPPYVWGKWARGY